LALPDVLHRADAAQAQPPLSAIWVGWQTPKGGRIKSGGIITGS